MDWQQPVALGVVAATAAIFLWRRFKPRRFSFERDTACGCSAPPGQTPPGLVIQGRRGEQATVRFTPSAPRSNPVRKPIPGSPPV